MRGIDKLKKYHSKPKPPKPPKFAYDERVRIKKLWNPGFSPVCLNCGKTENLPTVTVQVSRIVEDAVQFAGYLCFLCARDAGMLKTHEAQQNLFEET